MKYRFYFNFPTVNERNRTRFIIHCNTCNCQSVGNSRNGFWTDWYDDYEDAFNHLNKLIDSFRVDDFEIDTCINCLSEIAQ